MTDIARYKSDSPHDVVKNWLRSRETIEFLGLWESLHNPSFKQVEFDLFRSQAGLNAFTMSPSKWINGVNAIGTFDFTKRYGRQANADIISSEWDSIARIVGRRKFELIINV